MSERIFQAEIKPRNSSDLLFLGLTLQKIHQLIDTTRFDGEHIFLNDSNEFNLLWSYCRGRHTFYEIPLKIVDKWHIFICKALWKINHRKDIVFSRDRADQSFLDTLTEFCGSKDLMISYIPIEWEE